MCSKYQHPKPYGFLKQLPDSLGYTAILMIACRLLKQGIFILTHDTITLDDLTKLFILHVFSKHGVPVSNLGLWNRNIAVESLLEEELVDRIPQ